MSAQAIELLQTALKTMTIIALGIYAVFAFVLITQMKIKRQTVESAIGPFLSSIAYIHFLLSIGLVILAFLIL